MILSDWEPLWWNGIRKMTMKRFQLIKMMIWWPDITSNENSAIIIIIEIIFLKHFILTPACPKCSVMPQHNYLSRPRPNCERRCSIRHWSIEGYQLEKCFQKTPRCLLTLAPGDCSDCCQAQGHLSTLVKFTFREDPEIRSVFAWSTTNQQSDIHHTTYLSSTLLVKVRWWSVGQGNVREGQVNVRWSSGEV